MLRLKADFTRVRTVFMRGIEGGGCGIGTTSSSICYRMARGGGQITTCQLPKKKSRRITQKGVPVAQLQAGECFGHDVPRALHV